MPGAILTRPPFLRPAMSAPDLTEHTLDSSDEYRGRLLHVKKDRVRLPNGGESTREYIVHPGAAVIIPLFDNGDILLERQHRYPLRRDFIELPAGKFDPDETELVFEKLPGTPVEFRDRERRARGDRGHGQAC